MTDCLERKKREKYRSTITLDIGLKRDFHYQTDHNIKLFLAHKISYSYLRPSINGLVTDSNTKICCHDFMLAQFQSTTANKIDTEQYPRLYEVIQGMRS